METIRNEEGVALVTALMLTLIALAVMMSVLYFIMQGTQLSASHKRYKTALEASHGGVEVFTKEIIPLVFANNTTAGIASRFSWVNMQVPVKSACFQQKLTLSPKGWTACDAGSTTFDPKTKPDIFFKLSGMTTGTGFSVFAKLVDTTPGNSDLSGFELLESGAGVTGASSGVSPQHIPALYRIEVQGERESNPQEKANLSVLYAY